MLREGAQRSWAEGLDQQAIFNFLALDSEYGPMRNFIEQVNDLSTAA